MSSPDKEQLKREWQAVAKRITALWRDHMNGTYVSLASALKKLQVGISPEVLGQNLRPKGRRPRNAPDLINAIAVVLTDKFSDRRPDLQPKEFENAVKRHILTGTASPLTTLPTTEIKCPSRFVSLSSALLTFDLWTPSASGAAIVREFAPVLGDEAAELVKRLSSSAIEAIARGDFDAQRGIANETIELGERTGQTSLVGEGLYLKGEALRLIADFEPNRNEARRLRREAEEFYGRAESALSGDPRATRGRARTIEVLGDLDGAMEIFVQASAGIDARRNLTQKDESLSLAHERIRTLRHKINCLAAMQGESPLATPQAQRREDEIRRLILESEPQHQATLRCLQQHQGWWLIEWFMAQVLHAKGWTAIQEHSRAARRLEWSLKLRIEMMPEEGPLSSVELGNLHWWSAVAREARGGFEPAQEGILEALKSALDGGKDRRTVKALGTSFLEAGAAPWMVDTKL